MVRCVWFACSCLISGQFASLYLSHDHDVQRCAKRMNCPCYFHILCYTLSAKIENIKENTSAGCGSVIGVDKWIKPCNIVITNCLYHCCAITFKFNSIQNILFNSGLVVLKGLCGDDNGVNHMKSFVVRPLSMPRYMRNSSFASTLANITTLCFTIHVIISCLACNEKIVAHVLRATFHGQVGVWPSLYNSCTMTSYGTDRYVVPLGQSWCHGPTILR